MNYYYSDGETQFGPFTLEELKTKNITPKTMIWYDGLNDWKLANEEPLLSELFKSIPPPLKKQITPTPPKINNSKKNTFKYWIIIILTVLISTIITIYIYNLPDSSNDKSLKDSSNSTSKYDEPVREKTPAELRQELRIKENNNPKSYLSVTYSLDFGFFSGKDIINGNINNSASIATYKDVVLNVTFRTATNTDIYSESYVIYKYFKPNTSTNFKLKVNSPNGTKKIHVSISTAKYK